MAVKISKATSGAIGPGKGDLYEILAAMHNDIANLRAALIEHLDNGGHTAAANTTAQNVTDATPAAQSTELA